MDISFRTSPDRYRHWRLAADGNVATLTLDVPPGGGIKPGYELKMNSYDLGVFIELHDAVQRLRFCPQISAVVLTSGMARTFCSGANIAMLAGSSHAFKVNFCKFCNETLAAIEDAAARSGQVYIAALNGTAAGGGYEIALACAVIVLTDDGSSVVALPEIPVLGVLPGTGGLTRLTDKRGVRRDLADVFSTTAEGVRGQRALDWRLVDVLARPSDFEATVRRLAAAPAQDGPAAERGLAVSTAAAATASAAPRGTHAGDLPAGRPQHEAAGLELPDIHFYEKEDTRDYEHVRARFDREAATARLDIAGPAQVPADLAGLHAAGGAAWPIAAARELDDVICHLRFAEPDIGSWVITTSGDPALVRASDELLAGGDDWLAREITGLWRRALRRLEASSRSLIALIEPGSCFTGTLLELALAADRQYMLDDSPAAIGLTAMNYGPLTTAGGATRLQVRFGGDAAALAAVGDLAGQQLTAAQALELGLVTQAPDELDWDEEVRLAISERASFSPDALSAMEANFRSAGPESLETKITGRLAAWQNWIFQRPNAAGERGALRRYGTGRRPDYDRKRV